jgi:ABC-type nitrate/sulfonate/bicarbonate transport system substrate-binding protein
MKFFKLIKMAISTFLISINIYASQQQEDIKLENISVQLLWKHQFEFAGFYMAIEKGFYRNRGLNVELREFNGKNIVDEVLSRKADFGVGYSSLVINKSAGKNIRALVAFFQSSPAVLLTKKRNDIKSIADLRGKTLNIGYNDVSYAGIRAMLQSRGIDFSGIKGIPNQFDLNLLIEDKIDGFFSYRSNEPFILDEMNISYLIWSPVDFGFDFYDDILFTSQTLIDQNSNLVKDFYEATFQGWDYAFSNIDETVDVIFNKYNSSLNKSRNSLIFEAKELLKLAKRDGVPFGDISEKRLETAEGIYRLLGFISTPKSGSQDFIYRVNDVTLSKDEKEYLRNHKNIKYCINPDWMPYEKIDNNKHIGVSKNFIAIFERELEVKFSLVKTRSFEETLNALKNGDCQITPMIPITKNKNLQIENIVFSRSYIEFPLVVATKSDELFVSNIESLKGKKIAVVRDNPIYQEIKNKYNLELIFIDSIREGMTKILTGEIYGIIDTLLSIGYEIRNNFAGLIAITGKLDVPYEISVGTTLKEPILQQIMCKTVSSTGDELKKIVIRELVDLKIQNSGIDESIIKKIAILIIIFLLIVLYKNRKLLRLQIKTAIENKFLTDSIKYALHIQEKLLPNNDIFNKFFSDWFIIWRPRNIVAGDIYFIEEISNDEVLIFVIDGTGHGVPGAFITLLVKAIQRQILNDIANGTLDPALPNEMLSIFDRELKAILNHGNDILEAENGFDGGILYYNRRNNIINFSGASTNLRIISNDFLKIISGDRKSVGYKNRQNIEIYKNNIIKISECSNIYMMTDGMVDQTGGKKGLSLGNRHINEILLETTSRSMKRQKSKVLEIYNNYMRNQEQKDDVTLIGIRIIPNNNGESCSI